MFRLWAEKEARNLTRACKAGLMVPKPLLQRQHVLVMDFLGDDGWPAPQLKEETHLSCCRGWWWRAYVECLEAARLLLLRCSLVHGDLSEYNVLYHNETCHFIDFGQSVHKAHPRAMELLARDLNTMEAFMEKRRVQRLGESLAFAFVTQYVGANEVAGAALQALSISKAEDGEEAALALLQDLNAEAVQSGETEEDIEAEDTEDKSTGDELAGDDGVDEVAEDDEEPADVEHQGNNAGDKVDLLERERARTKEARMWARAKMAPTDYSI
ncbi:RIO1 family-domain-containing protein [Tribonema minus]|uniref:non-specific serine/threonine protein kinase n=1 Tax=Tribonema minus TaxID=303371 RepID=A0A835YXK3_9STRA|nr:RIO1 family-domain-containing protein [Tribonema minus]